MIRKPDQVTIVIVSEEEAKEASVRHALRCLWRDGGFLVKAMVRQGRRFAATVTRGWEYKNRWWTRYDHQEQEF